jgi:hypothetical protein
MNQVVVSTEEQRLAILSMEESLKSLPQIKMEAKHYIAGGMYARELFMPKGSAVTGKIHIKEHLVILCGDVSVATNDGVTRYTGYCTFVGSPGSKRALFMHEDTVWTAIHATDKLTVEECEETLVTNSYEEFLKIAGDPQCLIG